MVSELVGKSKGGGSLGIVAEPVIANRFVIRFAVQLFRRQPTPKVCWRGASRE